MWDELILLGWLQFKRDDRQIRQDTEVVFITVVKILEGFSFLTRAGGVLFRMQTVVYVSLLLSYLYNFIYIMLYKYLYTSVQ